MRVRLAAATVLAVAAAAPPELLRASLASAAAVLFEALPFVAAGAVTARLLPRGRELVPWLGCGCGGGPAARSLPGAAAAWLALGPAAALARWLAAALVARVLRTSPNACAGESSDAGHGGLLGELRGIVPAALLAAAAAQVLSLADFARLGPVWQFAAGAVFGFVSSACGIGIVAVGASLHARAPLASAGFLCVAGIADLRALSRVHGHRVPANDAAAYALLAIGAGFVALKHGNTLVHPAIALALIPCTLACGVAFVRHRGASYWPARIAPMLMLAGALAGAPPPVYRATESTLSDAFAGERLSFTGSLVRSGRVETLVRYAITCCRADATPIVVRLSRTLSQREGAWLRVDGTLVSGSDGLALRPGGVVELPPPADPFVYR